MIFCRKHAQLETFGFQNRISLLFFSPFSRYIVFWCLAADGPNKVNIAAGAVTRSSQSGGWRRRQDGERRRYWRRRRLRRSSYSSSSRGDPIRWWHLASTVSTHLSSGDARRESRGGARRRPTFYASISNRSLYNTRAILNSCCISSILKFDSKMFGLWLFTFLVCFF